MARKVTKDALGKVIPPDFTIPVAKVPKITPVKEGQEHPVGKHGQYKLFHEHVWPKGYTPERLKQVNEAQFQVRGHGFYPIDNNSSLDEVKKGKEINNKIATSMFNTSLATSTAPIEDIRNTASTVSVGTLYKETGNKTGSSFSSSGQHINLNFTGMNTPADIATVTLHEFGHAQDYVSNTEEFNKAPIADYGHTTNGKASPRREGYAEGYRLAHARITRGQKRTGGDGTQYGYDMTGWGDVDSSVKFVEQRNKVFKEATGKDFENLEYLYPAKKTPPEGRKPEQLKLFDDL